MTDYQTLLDACHKPFKWHSHEFLQGKFIYVRVQDTVLRLNSLGVPWSFDQGPVEITENPARTKPSKFAPEGNIQYDAVTYGQLSIEGMGSRGAPGASTSTDKDNASKAAHSLALRKAASLFGVSHYLMQNPNDNAEFVNFMANANLDDLTDIKKAVKMAADLEGIDAKTWLTTVYGFHGEDFNSVGLLKNVLQAAGRI
jgi:hypothetical protein